LWRHHSTLTTETITELNFREPPHEFGSQLLEAGGELHEMQATLGHRTIRMTGRYLNATQKGVKGAFKKLVCSMALGFRPALIALGVVACFSCGDGTTGPSRLPTGIWGGDHISLSITATSTHLELDCAHGDIPSVLTLDRQGQFQIGGTYAREHGGPIRQGEVPDSHPAIYSGQVASTTMTLTIRLSDVNESIGGFTLVSGSPGRVFKCL
jgi:hypothetical protein